MKTMQLTDFKVLSFDCYGTLIDWESGLLRALRPLLDRLDPEPAPELILARFSHFEAAQQRITPTKRYSDILAITFKRLCEYFGIGMPWEACLAFGNTIRDWPAFADSIVALAYLKRHFKLVVLSNVDNESFAASNVRLGVAFDAIVTAEDTGAYKPAQQGFEYMMARLAERGIAPGDILHTAQSLFHDHVPAAALGLARCWIDRRDGREGSGATPIPESVPTPAFRFASLAALADAHRTAIGARRP